MEQRDSWHQAQGNKGDNVLTTQAPCNPQGDGLGMRREEGGNDDMSVMITVRSPTDHSWAWPEGTWFSAMMGHKSMGQAWSLWGIEVCVCCFICFQPEGEGRQELLEPGSEKFDQFKPPAYKVIL